MSKAPWLDEAKKHEGKSEYDSRFSRYMAGFWRIVGLPNYRTIAGASFAWCGLFVASMLYLEQMPWQKNGAGARNWMTYGQAIDWRKQGIPRGAIVQINHNLKCGSGSGNHVAFANGDCTAQDLLRDKATIELFGGNQGNRAKVSTYSVREICAVRWPPDVALPGPVTVTTSCNGKSADKESTR